MKLTKVEMQKMIEKRQFELDAIKYLLNEGKEDVISLLTESDYEKMQQAIKRGMKRDLAISHVAIIRKFESLNIRPKMKVSTTKEQIKQRFQEMELFSAKVERVLGNKPIIELIECSGKSSCGTFDLRTLNKNLL